MSDAILRISAPRPPEASPPFTFPLIATIAPVVAALVIWVLTSSPFALVFAALGPVTALASLADSRVRARRSKIREAARFARDVELTVEAIDDAHDAESAGLAERTPFARELIARVGADPYRWRGDLHTMFPVALGVGGVRSRLELARPAPASSDSADVIQTLQALADRAAGFDGPVTVDARLGIGVVGAAPRADAVARALAVQVAWALPPDGHWCSVGPRERAWADSMPHRSRPTAPGQDRELRFGRHGSNEPAILIAVADSARDLPGACAVVIRVGGYDDGAIVDHPDRAERRSVRLDALSLAEAHEWAVAHSADAVRESRAPGVAALPPRIALRDLPVGTRSAGLSCCFALDESGPLEIDLVGDGPHAVIGGTTGSGKSELLVSWLLAMAAAHPPSAVTFLLVDFKGGSAFDALKRLPHTAGIVTDLDGDQALRALESLRAELQHRERRVAQAGVRSVDDVPDLPRLVIVVDEFAAMLAELPELHALFADIAARGRSLGVHLVLCTQRPAGVVRDAVLANADLRISLRVNNRADSDAVVGVDDAAEIPASARGRGILTSAGENPRLVQFALADPDDAERIAALRPAGAPVRAPWCEPLPAVLDLAEVPESIEGAAFGLLDLPRQQRRGVAVWNLGGEGHVLVLGGPGSGKSTALEALAARAAVVGRRTHWLPGTVDAAWDVIAELAGRTDRLVIADDLDSLLARMPAEYRSSVIERLGEILRDGPSRGIHLAIAAQRLTAELASLAGLVPNRLLLRHPSRQDFVLAGGEGSRFDASWVPGAGLWRGDRVQIGQGAPPRPAAERARVCDLAVGRPLAIVSPRVAVLAERLSSSGAVVELGALRDDPLQALAAAKPSGVGRAILLGTVDDWQSRWGAIGAVRRVADVLFEGCSTVDFRALTRSRELPPPLVPSSDAAAGLPCWRLEPDGTASRVLLPA